MMRIQVNKDHKHLNCLTTACFTSISESRGTNHGVKAIKQWLEEQNTGCKVDRITNLMSQ